MQGPATIKQRETMLLAHRKTVEAEQRKIAENLQEIDYKLNVYQSPDAVATVTKEQQFVQQEKLVNQLPNPYAQTILSK